MKTSKIFIIGPGRSGTTLLLKLLNRSGIKSIFTPYNEEHFSEDKRAGCEGTIQWNDKLDDKTLRKGFAEGLPRLIKAPALSTALRPIMERKLIKVEHFFIPLRSLDTITKSRLDAKTPWEGISDRFEVQRDYAALTTGYAIDLAISNSVPYTILEFPKFAKDFEYCYSCVKPVLDITKAKFKKVFNDTVDYNSIRFKTV